jgi:hypothetical protein
VLAGIQAGRAALITEAGGARASPASVADADTPTSPSKADGKDAEGSFFRGTSNVTQSSSITAAAGASSSFIKQGAAKARMSRRASIQVEEKR